jgi:hypothetical protein
MYSVVLLACGAAALVAPARISAPRTVVGYEASQALPFMSKPEKLDGYVAESARPPRDATAREEGRPVRKPETAQSWRVPFRAAFRLLGLLAFVSVPPSTLDRRSMAGDVGFDPFSFTEVFDVKWLSGGRVAAKKETTFRRIRGRKRGSFRKRTVWRKRAPAARAGACGTPWRAKGAPAARAGGCGRCPWCILCRRPTCTLCRRAAARREAEIKHGRICMLAWTGFVATDIGIVLPGAAGVGAASRNGAGSDAGA